MFDVEHPDDCPVERYGVSDGYVEELNCEVAYHLDNIGLAFCFRHADDPDSAYDSAQPVGVGRHAIEPWSSHHPGGPWGPAEWDGGLCLAEVES